MTTATTTTRGFNAPCPRCGENAVRVSQADLNDLSCTECETDFTLDDIRELVNGWTAVLAWLDSAPVTE